jgi:16S rRNA (guanine(966)-N(2))-methyltransferase RsmD
MRIAAGQFKGKKLSAGSDLSIRPITNRLKEIIFSVLSDFFYDKTVLDLFSGSGSLGLESLSRGAGQVTFVEKEDSSLRILKNNIDTLGVDPNLIQIFKSDVLNFINENNNKYNLILSDPPFKYSIMQQMINQIFIRDIIEDNGLLMIHHEIDNPLSTEDVPYLLLKQKKIGRSLLSFIVKEAADV